MHTPFSKELPPSNAIPLVHIDLLMEDYAQLLTDKTENMKQTTLSAGIQSSY